MLWSECATRHSFFLPRAAGFKKVLLTMVMMMSATTTMINRGGTTTRRRKESSSCSTSSSSSMKSMTMRSRVTGKKHVTTATATGTAMCTGRRSSMRIASVRNRDVDEPALAVSTGRRAAASGGARARTTRARASGGNDDREREIEEATKKWGLEVGLWKVFKSKSTGNDGGGENNADFSRMDMAKKLLKRYGSAYLLTSISLSLISITVFYFAVSSGIDVASLLEKVGINVNATSEQFGTFALAYAAHKASSPIRFGPTVALTPLVAKWLGKEIAVEDEMDGDASDGGDASSSD
jgi:ribosomal protein L12E/L44/L45/RPP1/RPP2